MGVESSMNCPNCGNHLTLRKGLVGKSQPEECDSCGEAVDRNRTTLEK